MAAPAPGPPPPKPGNPPGEPPANDGAPLRTRSALSTPSTEVSASMSASALSDGAGATVSSRTDCPESPRTNASGLSSARSRPWSTMPTRSVSSAASSMSWVVSTMVTPRSRSSRMRSQTNSRACGSRPVVGSSRNSTCGSWMSDRAIINRWAIPPKYQSTLMSAWSSSPNCSSSAAARSLRSVRPTPWYAAWNVRFWRGVRDRSRLLRCGTTARRDRAATGSRRTSIPASTARPLVACTRVVSTPTVVVLPAPLGPSSPNTSPWDTPKDSPSTALTSRFGYRLTSSTTSTARSVSVICALLLLVVDDQIDEELADHLLLGRIALGLGGLERFPEVLADLAGTCPAGLGNDQPDHPAVGLVALTPDVPGLLQGVDHPGQGL